MTLSASSTSALTVNYATSNGTATASSDYTAKTGTLTFAANTTSQTFTVSVTGDTLDEADETLTVTLSSPSSGTEIATLTGTGTILDDDPKFSINSPTVTESDSGSVNLDFEVTLSASSTSQLTVAYAQTGGTATSGTDYTAVAAGTLTFPSGTTSRTIRVSVTGDTLNEANETVIVTLSNATGGAGISTATGTGTITDNDTPSFSIDDASVVEGDSGQTNLTFTVTLSLQSSSALTVNYTTSSSGSGFGHATAGDDYTAVTTAGSVTIAANTTSNTFNIVVSGDTTAEPDETFTVTLSGNPAGHEP